MNYTALEKEAAEGARGRDKILAEITTDLVTFARFDCNSTSSWFSSNVFFCFASCHAFGDFPFLSIQNIVSCCSSERNIKSSAHNTIAIHSNNRRKENRKRREETAHILLSNLSNVK